MMNGFVRVQVLRFGADRGLFTVHGSCGFKSVCTQQRPLSLEQRLLQRSINISASGSTFTQSEMTFV